jgi:hypothetical protein
MDTLDQIAHTTTEQAVDGVIEVPLTYNQVSFALKPLPKLTDLNIRDMRDVARAEIEQMFRVIDYLECGLLRAASRAPLSIRRLCERASQMTLQSGMPLSADMAEDVLGCLFEEGITSYLDAHPGTEEMLMHTYELHKEAELRDMLLALIEQRYGAELQEQLSGSDPQ